MGEHSPKFVSSAQICDSNKLEMGSGKRVGGRRRRVSRLLGKFRVQFDLHGVLHEGTVQNFSETGFYVETKAQLRSGDILTFQCELPKADTISAEGIVRWVKELPEIPLIGGMGVELTDAPLPYLSFVKRFRSFLGKDRRTPRQRFEVVHPVTFSSEAQFVTEYCENLSRGGMYLTTQKDLKVGQTFQLDLSIPGGPEPLELEGRVAYRLDSGEAEQMGRTQGVGLQFVDLSQDATARLNKYLRSLQIRHFREDREACVPSEGSMSDYLVPELLLDLHVRGETGVLVLIREEVTKWVYFFQGKPVHVQSSLGTDTLDYHLLRLGLITEDQQSAAITESEKIDINIDKALRRLKLVNPVRLVQYRVSHHEEIITNSFPWFDGQFRWVKAETWDDELVSLPLRFPALVFDGITQWYNPTTLEAWMGLIGKSMVVASPEGGVEMELPHQARKILKELGSPRKISEVCQRIQVPLDEALPLLFALILAGMARLLSEPDRKEELETAIDPPQEEIPSVQTSDEPIAVQTSDELAGIHTPDQPEEKEETLPTLELFPLDDPVPLPDGVVEQVEKDHERLKDLDFIDMMGFKIGMSEEALSEIYLKLSEPYSVENMNAFSKTPHHDKATQVRDWLDVAFATLNDPVRRDIFMRRKTSPSTKEKQIETDWVLFGTLRHLEKGRLEEAKKMVEQGHKDHPGDTYLIGLLGWVLFQENPDKNLKQACDLLDRGIATNGADAQLRYFRGLIHLHAGEKKQAIIHLRRVLLLQPTFPGAKEQLDETLQG